MIGGREPKDFRLGWWGSRRFVGVANESCSKYVGKCGLL